MRRGPWSKALVEAVAGAREPRELTVDDLRFVEGTISARVGACDASLTAEPVSPRVWAAVSRFVRGNIPLELAAEGREQSEHLDHLLREDWDAPLVPADLHCECSCHGPGACLHVVGLVHAAAAAIDESPVLMLRWRGCTPARAELGRRPVELDDVDDTAGPDAAAWEGGPLPAPRAVRPLPAGAVLKRLGPSGVVVGGEDLAVSLERAYRAFAPVEEPAHTLHTDPGE